MVRTRAHRGRVLLAIVVFGLLGLIQGLFDLRGVLTTPLRRADELISFQDPRPRSTLWIEGTRPIVRTIEGMDRPLLGLAVVLLLGFFWLLATLLDPEFQLLKPAEENPGSGVTAHVDLRRLWSAAFGVLLSLWLFGLTSFARGLFPTRDRGSSFATFLSGLPGFLVSLFGSFGVVVYSVILGTTLWVIWGPGGIVSGPRRGFPVRTALWGAAAGIAALPIITAISPARVWIQQAGEAYSLADRAGWSLLMALAVGLPAVGVALVASLALLFRPRPVTAASVRVLAGFAAAMALAAGGAARAANAWLKGMDTGSTSLSARLHLRASPLARYALILTPDGGTMMSITGDGSDDGQGRDSIACDGPTTQAAQDLLDRTRYRSRLAMRAFFHLASCASIDWQATRSLEIAMAMLERAPNHFAAQFLQERLADCPVTPENRKYLDALADPRRFVWPQPRGKQWLGAAYLRFGDMPRAREFLLKSELQPGVLAAMLRGAAPLPNGSVSGVLSLAGKPAKGIRVGLVRWDQAGRMFGMGDPRLRRGWCPPIEWRIVSCFTYTDGAGRFSLKDVPEGRYLLVLTGGEIGRNPAPGMVERAPRVIEVDHRHARVDLGRFNVRYLKPIRAPRGAPPTSTA